jgi:hypothetical protein
MRDDRCECLNRRKEHTHNTFLDRAASGEARQARWAGLDRSIFTARLGKVAI